MESIIGWFVFLAAVVAANWWAVIQVRDARGLKKRSINIPHPAGIALAGAVFFNLVLGVVAFKATVAALASITQR